MHLWGTYHVSGPYQEQEIQRWTIQSSLDLRCSLPKPITTQDGKCYNQSRHGVLQSTEKVPNGSLVEKGCSASFHREVICYFNLQGLEGDSWQMRDKGRFWKKKPPFSLRKWIQGIVNNVTTGKRSHNGLGKKESHERKINETKTEWWRILVRKWQN